MLTLVAFVVLLGVLITVHEAGHFFVAKAFGVRVLTFSLGFGPRLIGFTRGDTEYRISVLPLGGYVKMYGDDITDEVPPEEQHRSFLGQPFLKKSAIAVAGPLANLVLPVALFFGLYVGHEKVPDAVVGTVLDGEPAAQAGLAPGDRVVAVEGKPVHLLSELQEIVGPRAGVPLHLTVKRNDKELDLVVTPRAVPDPTIFDRKRTVGRLGIMSSVELPVVVVDRGSPAAHAGIKDMDRVIAVDGAPTRSKAELLASLDAAAGSGTAVLDVVTGDDDKKARKVTLQSAPAPAADVVTDRFGVTSDELASVPLQTRVAQTLEATREAREAAARRFGLSPVDGRVAQVQDGTVAAEKNVVADRERIVAVDGKRLVTVNDLQSPLTADPDGIHVIGLTGGNAPRVLAFRMLPAPQRQMGGLKIFGAQVAAAYGEGAVVERTVGPLEAAKRAVAETGALVVDVFQGFGLLFSGGVGLQALSGPISIAKMSGEAASMGAGSYVTIMGLISVNLAIINLMPIPVLDGGHLVFFVVELVTRRKVGAEVRRKATIVGLVIVGLLMVVAMTNDVLGLFSS